MRRIRLLDALLASGLAAASLPAASFGQAASSAGAAAPSAGASAGASDSPGSGGDPTKIPAAVSSGWSWYRPWYVVQGTPNGGVITYVQAPLIPVVQPVPIVVVQPSRGPIAPPPPPGLIRPASLPRKTIAVTRADRERAGRYLTYGDRMFRVGNSKRAEERYEQAMRANPHWAAPRLRLAQVALVRQRYADAADFLREAETAEPGWIVAAPDVQSLYPAPADFARHVARLESHLHKNPEDRDAWLVLGAQWFLSRRENRAADVFSRLDDPHHKPDVALAAFLDAARLGPAPPPAPVPEPDPAPARGPIRPSP